MKRTMRWLPVFLLVAVCLLGFAACETGEKNEAEPFGAWTLVTAPGCETAGEEMRVSLTDPTHTETRAVAPAGHDWNAWETVNAPTCLTAGSEKRTCKTCENADYRAVEPLGHAYGEWETTVAPDCTAAGTQKRVCLHDASHIEVQSIPALGHDWTAWVITRAPSCTAAGVETRYCRNCNGHTQLRSIDALGHDWLDPVVAVQATCEHGGETVRVCRNDASHVITSKTPALSHRWSDWVVHVAPTETQDGEEIRVCEYDSAHTETRVAPALGSDRLSYALTADETAYKVVRNAVQAPSVTGTVVIPAVHNGKPVAEIDMGAFMNYLYVEHIVILGNNMRTVGHHAFANCKALQSVTLPEGITQVGRFAFIACRKLQSLHLPASLTEISFTDLMRDSYALETLTVADGNPVFRSENNCIIEKATNTVVFGTKTARIPDGVAAIGSHAFSYRGTEHIEIPASVTSIGSYAFSANSADLQSVTFAPGSRLKKIDEGAFAGGVRLTEIEIPDGVTQIEAYAFRNCAALQSIEIPASVSRLGYAAFENCTALRSVTFAPNSALSAIFGWTFANTALRGFEVPAGVTNVHGAAFPASLTSLTVADGNEALYGENNCVVTANGTLLAGISISTIPESVDYIGDYAFYDKGLERIRIPQKVIWIGRFAFAENPDLVSVTFAENCTVQEIGKNAFENCVRLQSIALPRNVHTVDEKAFYKCTALSSVTFGENSSLRSIGRYAFGDTALRTFTVPAKVTSIDSGAFMRTPLRGIAVEAGNTAFRVDGGSYAVTGTVGNEPVLEPVGGYLVEIATQTLLVGTNSGTFADDVTRIASHAFSAVTVSELVVPATVRYIDSFAFNGWDKTQTLHILGVQSQEEADETFAANWLNGCYANIVYGA